MLFYAGAGMLRDLDGDGGAGVAMALNDAQVEALVQRFSKTAKSRWRFMHVKPMMVEISKDFATDNGIDFDEVYDHLVKEVVRRDLVVLKYSHVNLGIQWNRGRKKGDPGDGSGE